LWKIFNMEKDFVPYELALKMKQLGFDEPCFGYYNEGTLSIEFIRNGNIFKETEDSIYFKENTSCLAPTFSQAFRWFREKGEDCIILPTSNLYTPVVYNEKTSGKKKELYDTYEEAELACLTKLIEIVENNLVD